MTTSGTKRTRKAETEDAKKKPKADEIKRAAAAAAAVAAAVPVEVILGFQKKDTPQEKTKGVASVSLLVMPANKKEESLGNPYEAKRVGVAVAVKQDTSTPNMSIVKSPSTPTKTVLNGGGGSTTTSMDHHYHSPPFTTMKRQASVPCILLFSVAFFLWCSVTLIGLLLSERLEHQLQMHQLRQVLQKSEQVGVPNIPSIEGYDEDDKQNNINHWKELVNNLEWQKKGMMKEFGEKLASLEFTME
jgi:hypothetical protein